MWTTPWHGLLANAAIVALVVSAWSNVTFRPRGSSDLGRPVEFGLLFGLGAIAVMQLPFEIQTGVFIDLRATMLAIAGFFGGPLPAFLAAAVALAFRAYLGGAGLLAGLASIVLAAGFGLGAWCLAKGKQKSLVTMVFFSASVAASQLLAALVLPQASWGAVLPHVLALMIPILWVTTLLASLAIANELHRREVVRKNHLYKLVIDSLPECLNVKDREGRFLIANPATARQIKAPGVEALIGQTDFDFFPEEIARNFRADETKVLAEAAPQLIEQKLAHRDGSRAWLSTLKAPLADSEGSIVGLITHNRDITEKRRLEAALAESERKATAALTNMADGLVMFDRDLNLVFCNEQYHAMFPLTADLRVPGTPAASILNAMIARGELVGIPINAANDWVSGSMSRLRQPGTVQFPLHNGRWIESRTRPAEDGSCFVVCSDITKAKENEKILLDLNKRLEEMAQTDGLTGLLNRRAFDSILSEETSRVGRGEQPLGLVLVDVDRFKAFNDTYGHTSGDECLRAVAECLRAVARRPSDRAVRYGGEEMALVLPNTSEDGAMALAQELRNRIRALAISHTSSEKGIVTVSAGVATLNQSTGASDAARLVRRADEALYAAKAGGRDLVRSWHPVKPKIVKSHKRRA